MPQSMTGFARKEVNEDWGTLICELKSVNNRFLELNFRLPESLREAEFGFRKRMKQALTRGKVDCTFHLQWQQQPQLLGQMDEDTLRLTIQAAETIANQLQNPSTINPMDILRSPGVLPPIQCDAKAVTEAAHATLIQALEELAQVRQREGLELQDAIQSRVVAIREHVQTVEKALPEIRQALETRLRHRLSELDMDVNPERLEQELVLQTQKMDVDEEIDRLKAHLNEVERILSSSSHQPMGRRLDFLMQELNREANTLGAKSQSVLSTQVSIEIKLLIEQMREQIQNIE